MQTVLNYTLSIDQKQT